MNVNAYTMFVDESSTYNLVEAFPIKHRSDGNYYVELQFQETIAVWTFKTKSSQPTLYTDARPISLLESLMAIKLNRLYSSKTFSSKNPYSISSSHRYKN